MPSIGIAQIQGVVRQKLKGRVQLDSAYCFVDFAEFIGGTKPYDTIGTYDTKGLLDWMFRQEAFDVDDNAADYERYFFEDGQFLRKKKAFELVVSLRPRIGKFLDDLIERYSLKDYDVVGFTSMMSQNISSFALARRLKKVHPNVVTVIGGPNTEHPMGKTIAENVPQIDYVFSGEALVSFPGFLEALEARDYAKIRTLKGVHCNSLVAERASAFATSREATPEPRKLPLLQVVQQSGGCGTSEVEENSGEEFNMNDMPMLDYAEYLERIERSPLGQSLKPDLIIPFQTSTGCWWADKVPCSFCGLTPHAFRQMNSEKAKSYISELIERYEGKFSVFEATDPCMPVEYPREVFPHVNQAKSAVLQYEVKAKMSSDDLREMARANVILPQPGIESVSTRTLKIMRKGVTAFDNVKFLRNSAEQGLYPIWNYLYGFPNNDYDELQSEKLIDDIQTLCHLPPPSSNVPIAFQRYSEYFKDRDKYGLRLRPHHTYFYTYAFDESVLSDLAYSFVDEAYSKNLFETYADMIQKINLEIVSWMYKFREGIPELVFIEPLVIKDTRFEKPRKYRISQVERDVLDFLREPQAMSSVARKFGLSAEETDKIIRQFVAARFVFVEREKYLSVVCERCSLKGDLYKGYYINFVRNSSNAFD
jgi:ribosomal peptide maturation radical SAM protein 1